MRPTRFYSKAQEKKVAKAVGGKRTPNSGATKWAKGDILSENFLIECKTKTKDSSSITLKEEWFLKNEEEAFAMGGKYPALCFDFGPSANKRYYVISEALFQMLDNYLKGEM